MGPWTYKSGFIQERWKDPLSLKKTSRYLEPPRGFSKPQTRGEWGHSNQLSDPSNDRVQK